MINNNLFGEILTLKPAKKKNVANQNENGGYSLRWANCD